MLLEVPGDTAARGLAWEGLSDRAGAASELVEAQEGLAGSDVVPMVLVATGPAGPEDT